MSSAQRAATEFKLANRAPDRLCNRRGITVSNQPAGSFSHYFKPEERALGSNYRFARRQGFAKYAACAVAVSIRMVGDEKNVGVLEQLQVIFVIQRPGDQRNRLCRRRSEAGEGRRRGGIRVAALQRKSRIQWSPVCVQNVYGRKDFGEALFLTGIAETCKVWRFSRRFVALGGPPRNNNRHVRHRLLKNCLILFP